MQDSDQQDPDESRRARIEALKEELVGGLLLSANEVGEILDVHPRTVLDHIHGGRLEAWQLGGSWKIPEQALRRFVKRAQRGGAEPDKRSPFDAVTWKGETYEVRLDDEWFRLEAVDGIELTTIVDFSKHRYGDRWQKRIDEDLVEVMKLLGFEPAATVILRLTPLGGDGRTITREAEMTREKRQAIWRGKYRPR